MKVFVAGATGAIGQPLVRQLVDGGHEVVGMTRRRPDEVEALGATPAVADALDADAVRAAVEQAAPDVVVNQLTDLDHPLNPRKYAQWLEGTNALRRNGTRNLITAAGTAHVVSQSVAFFYGFEPGVKTEDSPLLGMAGAEMGGAIVDLERQTLDAGGTVLRYGFFYGPRTAYDRDGQQIEVIKKRQMPVIGGGKGYFPFIHVVDAASATVAAVERRVPGVFNIVDDEPAPSHEWVPYVADLVGARKPFPVPGFVARVAAGPLAVMAMKMQPVSNTKAKAELGWHLRYPSWRNGFRAELG